jgi:hypothetical protein
VEKKPNRFRPEFQNNFRATNVTPAKAVQSGESDVSPRLTPKSQTTAFVDA